MANIVTWAKLHTGLFIPGGIGNLTDTLPPQGKTIKDFKMLLQDSGALILQWTEGSYTKRYMVGAANVAGALLAPVLTESTEKSTLV